MQGRGAARSIENISLGCAHGFAGLDFWEVCGKRLQVSIWDFKKNTAFKIMPMAVVSQASAPFIRSTKDHDIFDSSGLKQ